MLVFRRAGPAALVLLSLVGSPLLAQTTEPDGPDRVAREPRAEEPSTGRESIVDRVVARIASRTSGEPVGFYPWFGSIYAGGWLSVGPGFRVPYGDEGSFDGQVAISLKAYKLARARFASPATRRARVQAVFRGELIDAPSVAFYGLGNDTEASVREERDLRFTSASAGIEARPFGIHVGGDVGVLRARRAAFADDRSDIELTVSRAFLAFARWTVANNRRTGGEYRLDWARHRERGGGPAEIDRLDLALEEVVPIAPRRVSAAFRAAAATAFVPADSDVPFFLLPSLGGASNLRGYPSWRFRDEHSLFLDVETRWRVSKYLEATVFHGAGRVMAERREFGLHELRHVNGAGLRLYTSPTAVLRVEIAHGAEGAALVFAFNRSL